MRLLPVLFAASLFCIAAPAFGSVMITVDIDSQTMDVDVTDDSPVDQAMQDVDPESAAALSTAESYHWDVSTGKYGHDTPIGTFVPLLLDEHHRSREYHGAPMPYSIFIDLVRGIAIHGIVGRREVNALGGIASHGCVRLALANARTLYGIVEREGADNTTIIIR